MPSSKGKSPRRGAPGTCSPWWRAGGAPTPARTPRWPALEDAGEDQIAQRQRRIERLCRAAAGVAQRLVAGPADLALPSGGGVQAQWHFERRGGGPERLVFGPVV